VVAEQETARLSTQSGRLPLYRALALAALDPREGSTALEALPPLLRDDPAATAARTRLSATSSDHQDVALRIERARAEIDLGRGDHARAMLEPLAASQPAALILLAGMPDLVLDPWLQSPAMSDHTARAAVAIALSRRGEQQRAWELFSTVLGEKTTAGEEVPLASVLFWAERAARHAAPEHASALTARLLALSGEGAEIGLAWADEAQRRERAGAPLEEIRQAWERAGMALPATHPWQPAAVLRAVRPLIQAESQWETSRRLLERVAIGGGTEDLLRCRFLLAQVYEHLNLVTQALQVVGELRSLATPEQAEKLERMHARLISHATSEVQPGPLDAEN
jgi:tetratricopeptide (TPR) repeat protein